MSTLVDFRCHPEGITFDSWDSNVSFLFYEASLIYIHLNTKMYFYQEYLIQHDIMNVGGNYEECNRSEKLNKKI